MKITDLLKTKVENYWPCQRIEVRPCQHYDELEGNDFVVHFQAGKRLVAYRVSLETALTVENWLNRAALEAAKNGVPVNIYDHKPEDGKEAES